MNRIHSVITVGRWLAARFSFRCKAPERVMEMARYVIDAARVSPRVSTGLALGGLVFSGMTFFWVYTAIASAAHAGFIFAAITFVLLTSFVSVFSALPVFLVFAWGGLWLRLWEVNEEGVTESWVHPRILVEIDPAYVWTLSGDRIVVRLGYSGAAKDAPMPTRRQLQLMSDVAVTNATDKDRDRDFFSETQHRPMEKLSMGLMVVLILGVFFMLFAMMSERGEAVVV